MGPPTTHHPPPPPEPPPRHTAIAHLTAATAATPAAATRPFCGVSRDAGGRARRRAPRAGLARAAAARAAARRRDPRRGEVAREMAHRRHGAPRGVPRGGGGDRLDRHRRRRRRRRGPRAGERTAGVSPRGSRLRRECCRGRRRRRRRGGVAGQPSPPCVSAAAAGGGGGAADSAGRIDRPERTYALLSRRTLSHREFEVFGAFRSVAPCATSRGEVGGGEGAWGARAWRGHASARFYARRGNEIMNEEGALELFIPSPRGGGGGGGGGGAGDPAHALLTTASSGRPPANAALGGAARICVRLRVRPHPSDGGRDLLRR